MRPFLVGILVSLIVVGCGAADKVGSYCAYGAVSKAQRTGCEKHVSEARIDRLSTHAAMFARGELDSCLADAGPFCKTRDGVDKRPGWRRSTATAGGGTSGGLGGSDFGGGFGDYGDSDFGGGGYSDGDYGGGYGGSFGG